MKKFLSVMAALLLAVFTATGVHAANPSQAGTTTAVNAPAGVTVTPKAQDDIPVVKDQTGVLFAFEVEGKVGEEFDLTISNPEIQNGQRYTYIHYASDTDTTVKDSGTVVANGHQLTIHLTGCSPVVIKAAGAAGTNTNGNGAKANGTNGGSGVAVPNTVDAE